MDSVIRDKALGDRIGELEKRIEELEFKLKTPKEIEKNIWSADGILIGKLEHNKQNFCLNKNGDVEKVYNDYCPNNRFRTKKRAELERDRREVDYIMKKMACESREDNSWKRDWRKNQCYISMRMSCRGTSSILTATTSHIDLNKAYFDTEQYAQKCLNFLIEKYGEEKLKEIWGVK